MKLKNSLWNYLTIKSVYTKSNVYIIVDQCKQITIKIISHISLVYHQYQYQYQHCQYQHHNET